MRNTKLNDLTLLRQRAEEHIIMHSLESDLDLSEVDLIQLHHEFHVFQIELQMQNEELAK